MVNEAAGGRSNSSVQMVATASQLSRRDWQHGAKQSEGSRSLELHNERSTIEQAVLSSAAVLRRSKSFGSRSSENRADTQKVENKAFHRV